MPPGPPTTRRTPPCGAEHHPGRLLFDMNTGAAVTAYPALSAGGALLLGSANGTRDALRTPGP